MKKLFLIPVFFFFINIACGQNSDWIPRIDSLLGTDSQKAFNGTILIVQDGKTLYSKINGFADLDRKYSLKDNSQFIVGSVSKQFTAVLLLQEYEKGSLQLHVPIRHYLPELTQNWADSVSIHQLLTHTHGISGINKALAFPAGSQFLYSQIGYELLAQILEATSGKSFASLSTELFRKCNMKNSFHPGLQKHQNLVEGMSEQKDGSIQKDPYSLENYVAAGSFISTAPDLIKWNTCLHGGKLLADSTYRLMCSKQPIASRNHPVFGKTDYGYGTTIADQEGLLQIGLTGFAPGFVSLNYFFPQSKTSVVVLSNMAWDPVDFKNTFFYHTHVLDMVRKNL